MNEIVYIKKYRAHEEKRIFRKQNLFPVFMNKNVFKNTSVLESLFLKSLQLPFSAHIHYRIFPNEQ